MSAFSLKVAGFENTTKKQARAALQKVSMDLFADVIRDTPVETGRARANWIASVGTPASGVRNVEPGESAAQAISEGEAQEVVSGAFDDDQSVFLTNNLPYIRRLEYGHSQQKAPRGMVRINVERHKGAL